jgi:dihydropteroate synthase
MIAKNNGKPPIYLLNCKGNLIDLATPRVMGILNITDDSFYGASRFYTDGKSADLSAVIDKAGQMREEGATFLDVGGQSTRPGSTQWGLTEEIDRVVPVIEAIGKHFPEALVSIDTYHSPVARAAVKAGASLVNDISGGQLDPAMHATVAALHVPYVAMHLKGTPETMQESAIYDDVMTEVVTYLAAVTKACADAGILDVIVDPGFGFGKTIAHNWTILRELELLSILGRPVLVGLSRKSTIYKTLKTTPDKALNGSTVLHTIALIKGAAILRVHDVREAMEVIQLIHALSLPYLIPSTDFLSGWPGPP